MSLDPGLWNLVGLALALGLLGFIEPCTVGSSLLFVKYLEDRDRAAKVRTTLAFAATRSVFLGALGVGAALLGSAFLGLQRGFWILLGALYVALGGVYLAGRQRFLLRTLGPALTRVDETRGAAALGVIFGLNVPACTAPLLAAVLTATFGAAAAIQGFASLALFGLALSLPLVAAVFSARGSRWLDRIAGLSRRAPFWTGIVFVVLGIWSVYFGLAVG
jgi:cytochrome c-type biogenesis protein